MVASSSLGLPDVVAVDFASRIVVDPAAAEVVPAGHASAVPPSFCWPQSE